MLLRFELAFVTLVLVIEDLNLHALVGRVALERGAYADAVVAARLGFEFEPKDEIGVFFFGQQIPSAVKRADEHVVFDQITGAVTTHQFPALETLAVEERDKTAFGFARGLSRAGNHKQGEQSQ